MIDMREQRVVHGQECWVVILVKGDYNIITDQIYLEEWRARDYAKKRNKVYEAHNTNTKAVVRPKQIDLGDE